MANNRLADELLKWGLRHTGEGGGGDGSGSGAGGANGSSGIAQVSADIAAGKRPDLADPGLYDAIMGKSEAQMMKEELACALDQNRAEEDRCTALDNFEMLIEQVDNANNITSMGMWPPLLSLLSSPHPRIQLAAAWIVGTAVQNNDTAQVALLQHHPLPLLADLLEKSDLAEVRSKAMYALASLLRHNPAAVLQWQEECDGWKRLRAALSDPSIVLRRKVAFLLTSLLQQDEEDHSSEAAAAGPTPASAPTSTSAAPRSSSTAVTLSSADSASPSPAAAAAAPLERVGLATQASGVRHPNVAAHLLSSGLLRTLVSSVVAPPPELAGSQGAWEAVMPAGQDGDLDARSDLDYAEKATRAVLAFMDKARANKIAVDADSLALLRSLLAELRGKPLDPTSSASFRWAELDFDAPDVDKFAQALEQ